MRRLRINSLASAKHNLREIDRSQLRRCKFCSYVYCHQDRDDEYYENIEKKCHPEEFED